MDHMLPPSTDTGKLSVLHLKRYWSKSLGRRAGLLKDDALRDEWPLDVTMLGALGLGLEQTITYIFNANPSFDEFEDWVISVNKGNVEQANIARFNSLVLGGGAGLDEPLPNVLSPEQLAFWDENGYIILKNAVPREDCDDTIALICGHLGIDRYDASTWYHRHPDQQGIMVQLFQHAQLQRNRDTPIIRRAYQQLWRRNDVWVNTDRVGFNPPETSTYKFPGPKLHWDVSLAQPMPFGTQGILYLADTAANQGAFTLVPGFNHRLEPWLKSLPPGTNPRTQDIYALGAVPVAAGAGDFILWHQALPHGASPNTSSLPRFVQYINYQPIDPEIRQEWI